MYNIHCNTNLGEVICIMCHVPYEYVGFQEQVQMTCILVIIIEYKL